MPYPMDEVKQIVKANAPRFSSYGKLNAQNVLAMVKRARERGYVVTEDVVVTGVSAVSLPFRGPNGAPATAVSIAAVSSRLLASRETEFVTLLRSEIEEFERLLLKKSDRVNTLRQS